MSDLTTDPGDRGQLRQRAQQQLGAGIAPSSRGWGVSVEALALLHRLASAPASAADALKLLHELQVHQVELDLQQAQLEANGRELEGELARYQALFERAPVAYFVLDALGRVDEVNRAGAQLLGPVGVDIDGRRFDEFLLPESRPQLAALLEAVHGGTPAPACSVRPLRGAAGAARWRITAASVPASDAILLLVAADAGQTEG